MHRKLRALPCVSNWRRRTQAFHIVQSSEGTDVSLIEWDSGKHHLERNQTNYLFGARLLVSKCQKPNTLPFQLPIGGGGWQKLLMD